MVPLLDEIRHCRFKAVLRQSNVRQKCGVAGAQSSPASTCFGVIICPLTAPDRRLEPKSQEDLSRYGTGSLAAFRSSSWTGRVVGQHPNFPARQGASRLSPG